MFRKLDAKIYASPQIGVDDIAEAKALGVGLIVNNRPEGESDDQTDGATIEAAALAAGLDYCAIPITHAGFSASQVEAMRKALDSADDELVLAYCRSGTRSTFLWALAEASAGRSPDEIEACAHSAGYDVSSMRAQFDMLSARSA